MKNCINCGAPLEIGNTICPYCGTSYYDFSTIQLDKSTPIVLQLQIDNKLVLAQARLSSANVSYNVETTDVIANQQCAYRIPTYSTTLHLDFDLMNERMKLK